MSEHVATVVWMRGESKFTDGRYSRGHEWRFDGGVTVPASASPHNVRLPFSVEQAVDPEEALVAAVSSCHMLFFLSFVAKRGYVVDSYIDEAVGEMAEDDRGRVAVTKVRLRPRITFTGDSQPDSEMIQSIHHEAHEACFIANSLRSEVVVEE